VHDQDALTQIVKRLLDTPRERAAIGAAGKERAPLFSVERMVGEYESLMSNELLYASRRSSATNDLLRLEPLRGVPGIHD
jgi:hypothetical protein